ncbi:MAG: glycosyltransferase family 9 protein [Thiothrix sp.]|nr:glycosyltransferase family 9 protein [Thiothrix sp.]HPQ96140.1 glycosyltransferase family 9 protein [Thiolinea sp.]
MLTGQPANILIIRLSAIGDIVMASGLITPLRRAYPASRIYWLAQPECKPLLEAHPDLAGVIVWPRREWAARWQARDWRGLWLAVRQFRQVLRGYHFDLVLDLQGLLKSGLMAWLSGARQRIGLGSREGAQYLMHQVVSRHGGNPEHIGSEYRYLGTQLGLAVEPWRMGISLDETSREQADGLIHTHAGEKGFMVICPFTTRPQKHWFNAHWIELVEKINSRWQLPVLMLGGPADQEAARAISRHCRVIDLTGQTRLPVAAALIARCRLLVGVDTGLTHMGHAFRVPTLALFGSTRPYLDAGSPDSRVIYHALDCSPCKRHPVCGGRFECLRGITADEVMDTAQPLMEE